MDKKLTFKQQDKITKQIYKRYRDAKLDIVYLNQNYNYYPQIDLFRVKESSGSQDRAMIKRLNRIQRLEDYIQMIDQVHSHLKQSTLEFIENEYIQNQASGWWKDYYAPATYYRLKHLCLDELFECLMVFYSYNELIKLIG